MGILLRTARSAARDGVLGVRDVGRLVTRALSDGRLSRGERLELEQIQTELAHKMSPAASQALDRFLDLGETFDGGLAGTIFGLTARESEQLEQAGVGHLGDLMIRARTPGDRDQLASASRIHAARITDFAERADLARLVGIGKRNAALLHGAGIHNMGELAEQQPAVLRRQVLDFLASDAGKAITTRRPSLEQIETWVTRAKELPQVVSYTDVEGPNFSRAAFERLPDRHKALLIWGTDVRLGDTSVFEARRLTSTAPRRTPAAIAAYIRNAENTGFAGDYASAHLSSIERIKAGDEVLGYRLNFDVAGKEEQDDEGAGTGEFTGVEGWVSVALDSKGKVLGLDSEVWPGGNDEG